MRRMSKLQQIRNHPHSKESGSVRIFLCVYVCARSCLSIWGWKNQTSWAEDNGSPPMGGQSKTDYLLQSRFVKGSQSWIFIGRIDVEAETLILWPPDAKSWLIWKDPDAGKDWRWEEKEMTEKEMVGWHHWLSGHGFGWTLVGDGQGGLACCSPWGRKESDTTERLNWLTKRNENGETKARLGWNAVRLGWGGKRLCFLYADISCLGGNVNVSILSEWKEK